MELSYSHEASLSMRIKRLASESISLGLGRIQLSDADSEGESEEYPVQSGSFADFLRVVNNLAHATHLYDPFRKDLCSVISTHLGDGASFSVRLCQDLEQDSDVNSLGLSRKMIAKYPRIIRQEGSMKQYSAVELELLALCHTPLRQHPNIVKLLGLGWTRISAVDYTSLPVLYVEYANEATLDIFLADHDATPQEKLAFCLDIGRGLQALHQCQITHGDLKPSNVLVFRNDGRLLAKLGDFGYSVMKQGQDVKSRLLGGTIPWNAPEWEEVMWITDLQKTDIYSFGLVIWSIILDGVDPFQSEFCSKLASASDLKARDGVLSVARESVGNYYDNIYGDEPSIGEQFDFYLMSVLQPSKAFEVTLKLDRQKRDLDQAVLALQSSEAWGYVPRPKPKAEQMPLEMLVARDPMLRLGATPAATKHQLLQSYMADANDSKLSIERRGDSCAQLCLSYLDGFVTKDDGNAVEWAIRGAELGYLELSVLVYRLHQACGREIAPELMKKIKSWLFQGATRGSDIALEDLRSVDEESYQDAKYVLRKKYRGIGLRDQPRCEEISATRGNMENLKQASKITNEISVFVFSSARDNLLQCMAGCGAPLAGFQLVLDEYIQDQNAVNARGDSALILAMRSGHLQHAHCLLNHGCNATLANNRGETALHWIIQFEDQAELIELLEKLLSRGADINAVTTKFVYFDQKYGRPMDGGTVLHWAVERNRIDIIKLLLARGADRDIHHNHKTPIELAAHLHYSEALETLLDGAKYPLHSILIGEKATTPAWFPAQPHHPATKSLLNYVIAGSTRSQRMIVHGALHETALKCTIKILHDRGLCTADTERYSSFATATMVGSLEAMEYLISLGSDPSLYGAENLGSTIARGSYEMYSLLLENRLDPSKTAMEESSPLECLQKAVSSLNPNPLIIADLVQRCSNIDELARESTAFGRAVRARNFEAATQLLEAGADVNALTSLSSQDGIADGTILNDLIVLNSGLSLTPLKYLLEPIHPFREKVPDFVVRPRSGQTVLHIAARFSNKEVFLYLLSIFGTTSHVNARDCSGFTAMHYAAFEGNLHHVKELVRRGADVNADSSSARHEKGIGRRPLDVTEMFQTGSKQLGDGAKNEEEVYYNRISVREYLISQAAEYGIRPKTNFPSGWLFNASCKGRTRLAHALLKMENVDLEFGNEDGMTALSGACSMGARQVVNLLLNAGANPNTKSIKGITPLHIACGRGHKRVVIQLIKAKADVNAKDEGGVTPVEVVAMTNKRYDLVELLVLAGAELPQPPTIG